MLEQIDLAFNVKFLDPDEDVQMDVYEIRDTFLEFMSSIMVDYTRFIIDPGNQPETINNFKDSFDLDGFRLHKGAKKNY